MSQCFEIIEHRTQIKRSDFELGVSHSMPAGGHPERVVFKGGSRSECEAKLPALPYDSPEGFVLYYTVADVAS